MARKEIVVLGLDATRSAVKHCIEELKHVGTMGAKMKDRNFVAPFMMSLISCA